MIYLPNIKFREDIRISAGNGIDNFYNIFSKSFFSYSPSDYDWRIPAKTFENTLDYCQKSGYHALSMQEIEDLRCTQDKKSFIHDSFSSLSIQIAGTTKTGRNVVIYDHTNNYFSNPGNIENSLYNESRYPDLALLVYSQDEFNRLYNMVDNMNIFVVNHYDINRYGRLRMTINEAITHPLVIPFIGGRDRTEKYLMRYREFNGRKGKSISIDPSFLKESIDKPYGRFLESANYKDQYSSLGRTVSLNNVNIIGRRI